MSKTKVFQYMNENINDHIDSITGEVNYTTLAEDAWEHFHPGIEIEDESVYFKWSFVVGDRYERKTGITPNLITNSFLKEMINSRSSNDL